MAAVCKQNECPFCFDNYFNCLTVVWTFPVFSRITSKCFGLFQNFMKYLIITIFAMSKAKWSTSCCPKIKTNNAVKKIG